MGRLSYLVVTWVFLLPFGPLDSSAQNLEFYHPPVQVSVEIESFFVGDVEFSVRPLRRDERIPVEIFPSENHYMQLVVVEKNSGQIAGATDLSYRDRQAVIPHRVAKIPIYIHPHYQGRGLGLAVKTEIQNYAFRKLLADSIIAVIKKSNSASVRLHEKLGYRQTEEFYNNDFGYVLELLLDRPRVKKPTYLGKMGRCLAGLRSLSRLRG